jgi:hypothetical protein
MYGLTERIRLERMYLKELDMWDMHQSSASAAHRL